MASTEVLKRKQEVVEEIKTKLDKAASAVVIDYIGISVAQADSMRKKLREAGIDYKVYKNTLMTRAVEGTQFEPLTQIFDGPSALALSYDDATAAARVINGLIKEFKKMSFKAGIVEGSFYDADQMLAIAEIPGREELIAKFLGSIKSPVGKFVRTLAAISDAGIPSGGGGDVSAPSDEAASADAAEDSAQVEEAVSAEAEANADANAETEAGADVQTEEIATQEASSEEAAPAEEAPAESSEVVEDAAPAEDAGSEE